MYHVVVNPASRSGRGLRIWKDIESVFQEKNIRCEVFYSMNAGHVAQIVKDICNSVPGEINLIILGGDGTFNEALQGITDFDRVKIGYIPSGSSNDLARDLKLPSSPREILEQILSCTTPFCMDLGCLTYHQRPTTFSSAGKDAFSSQRYFAVSCGIGYDAAICEEVLTSRFKGFLNKIGCGKLIYLVIALKQLIMTKRGNCTITLNDLPAFQFKDFLFITSMIHRYEGGGFMFCPDADCSDGVIDICAVGPIAKPIILLALPSALKGQHLKYPHIYPYKTSTIRIDADRDFWVHTDGEVFAKCSSITIKCLQNRIQLLK